ncbi:MAG: M20/M25/M40 family metallo-hydrolase [Candidatus Thorarchaeota archaeon]|nr:M20/M25/M40 family metallo-hydrolase [Candidatus Thorarchaeota archaeon]
MTVDIVTELEKLVSFNTVNDSKSKPPIDCANYIKDRFEDFGFITDVIESKGFYTTLGRQGQGSFKILYLAHYDVVPPGEDWKTDPFKLHVEGDIAYGRGTCDNKGNIVSMLKLAETFQEKELPCTLLLAASGDEEIGGVNGALNLKEYLISNGLFPDYVVIADGINQVVIHRRRNVLPTIIKAKRKISRLKGREETIRFETDIFGSDSRHSAYQRRGVDRHALLTASKYLDLNGFACVRDMRGGFVKSNVIPSWVELDIIHPDAEGLELEYDETLTGIFRSLLPLSSTSFPTAYSDLGTTVSPNMLSIDDDLWTLYCDVRAMTDDNETVQDAFTKAISEKVELYSIRVPQTAGCVNSDRNSRLIRAAEWSLKKEGIKYKVMEGYGASDSRYFAGHTADVFDFGPKGDNLHGPNEWVSLSSLEENARFFYSLIEVLSRDPSPL